MYRDAAVHRHRLQSYAKVVTRAGHVTRAKQCFVGGLQSWKVCPHLSESTMKCKMQGQGAQGVEIVVVKIFIRGLNADVRMSVRGGVVAPGDRKGRVVGRVVEVRKSDRQCSSRRTVVAVAVVESICRDAGAFTGAGHVMSRSCAGFDGRSHLVVEPPVNVDAFCRMEWHGGAEKAAKVCKKSRRRKVAAAALVGNVQGVHIVDGKGYERIYWGTSGE